MSPRTTIFSARFSRQRISTHESELFGRFRESAREVLVKARCGLPPDADRLEHPAVRKVSWTALPQAPDDFTSRRSCAHTVHVDVFSLGRVQNVKHHPRFDSIQ